MNECSAYPRVHGGRLGLDVHKDTIAVAVALPGREEPVYRGEIKNQRKSLLRLIRVLSPNGELVWERGHPACSGRILRLPAHHDPCAPPARESDSMARRR